MISDKAKSLIADYIVTTFTKASVGTGGNSTYPSQLDLDVPLLTTKVSAIPVKSDESTVDFKITIQGTSADILGRTIREIGIFDSSDNLFTRLNFDAIGPFSSSEEVEFFIILEVE